MEDALAKIRPHTSSNLPHQKAPANLLVAIESTLSEQHAEKSPTAYFAALLTTLDGTLQRKDADSELLAAQLYLLALILPFVPSSVIRAHLSTIISLTTPLFPVLEPNAPPLRSQLTIYQTLLESLDRAQLETQGIRQAFASILRLAIDRRPKVRKKAAEVVKDVIAKPPPPTATHPYAQRVAEWVKSELEAATPFSRGKDDSGSTETAVHVLAFLRPLIGHLPPSSLPEITSLILNLPRLGSPYLSQSSYSILASIFSPDDENSDLSSQLPAVISAILSSPPLQNDSVLAPSWLHVVGNAMRAQSELDPDLDRLVKVWKTVWSYLESADTPTRQASAQALDLLISSIPPTASATLTNKFVEQTTKAFDSIAYARAIPHILSVASSLIGRLPSESTETLIHKIGHLRTLKGFEYKENADAALGVAMRVLGPQVLLELLPLNLEPADRTAGREPRAYLLPLLSTQPHASSVSHFVNYFVPLSERMFDLQQKAEEAGRQSEGKVWSVLVAQIWAGLPFYRWAVTDLKDALNPQFSQLLSQLLYSQPELRPAVLKALKVSVESNLALTIYSEPDALSSNSLPKITSSEAEANVSFLGSQAESWLAVLFNVFGSVGRDARPLVGEVISVWASISPEKQIAAAYAKVIALFRQDLAKPRPSAPVGSDGGGSVAAMTLDIVVLLLPYISEPDAQTLFDLLLSPEVLSGPDAGVQKRGYKILTRLIELEKLPSSSADGNNRVDSEKTLGKLDELSDGLSGGAKKDRFTLLGAMVKLLPADAMHVIPTLIPEAVLGTKETSEKARGAAFELVVEMGKKMSEGGVVKRGKLEGGEEDGDEVMDATASVEEYMTMVAGGLAGASPHMISATVTAISRLIFEFKDDISSTMNTEILSTLLVFLTSTNREIVKSVLGFIKLSIHTLPTELLQPHLPALVPALLKWSHDHKNHFKIKVRHIFERMLRRFPWDEVYACAGEEAEAAKVLVNVKKRKERAKRKKAARAEAEDEDEEDDETGKGGRAKAGAGDAFEDVLYGSESELEDSDDEQEPQQQQHPAGRQGKQKRKEHEGARLRIDDDEPMDLLEGAASRITNAKSGKRRQPGQDAARFKTDEETGKMVIDDENDSDGDAAAPSNGAQQDVAGTAYRESISGVDGFTRGPNGRVKFNKDTKKRRRENEDYEDDGGDVEMGDASAKGKNKRRSEVKLGHEFKAKRAGGDVKKGGVDPYAYVSLSQAAKKGGKGGKGKIGIAGKR